MDSRHHKANPRHSPSPRPVAVYQIATLEGFVVCNLDGIPELAEVQSSPEGCNWAWRELDILTVKVAEVVFQQEKNEWRIVGGLDLVELRLTAKLVQPDLTEDGTALLVAVSVALVSSTCFDHQANRVERSEHLVQVRLDMATLHLLGRMAGKEKLKSNAAV